MDKDFVTYIDTDSVYITLEDWLKSHVDMEKWEKLSLEDKIEYIKRIGKIIENHVNKRSFEETQKLHYNSQVDDFSIVFEQEKIALSGLFSTKKRYATWTLTDGGKWKDEMSITGMEIIRSDSPEIVKPMIRDVLEMILRFEPDNNIRKRITKYKKELKGCDPEMIAENKGINKTKKYIKEDGYIKGTPRHLKGLYFMKMLLEKFGLQDKYELPQEGNKAKIVYVTKNPYKVDSLSFLRWPEEFFDKGIFVDYDKMIENNFTKKIQGLLEVINKEELFMQSRNVESLFGG